MIRLRWWLAKKISPYEVMAVNLQICDGALVFPADTKNGIIEHCVFKRTAAQYPYPGLGPGWKRNPKHTLTNDQALFVPEEPSR